MQTRQTRNAADVADPAPREPNESSHGAKTPRRSGLAQAFQSSVFQRSAPLKPAAPHADAGGRRRARTFLLEIKTLTKIRDTIQPPASGAKAPSVQGAQTPKSGPSTSISGPVAAKGRTA
jgi:hypothetical protein